MEDITIIRGFLKPELASEYFEALKEDIPWTDTLINSRTCAEVKLKRMMAYVSDHIEDYRYADLSFKGESWSTLPNRSTTPLLYLRWDLETMLEKNFNSVLLNMYADGKDEIRWHSDKEETLGPNPVIACVNLGATRKFWFRHKDPNSEKFFYEVSHGDLLVMGENCQTNYLHAILKEKEVTKPRISLTFRYNKPVW